MHDGVVQAKPRPASGAPGVGARHRVGRDSAYAVGGAPDADAAAGWLAYHSKEVGRTSTDPGLGEKRADPAYGDAAELARASLVLLGLAGDGGIGTGYDAAGAFVAADALAVVEIVAGEDEVAAVGCAAAGGEVVDGVDPDVAEVQTRASRIRETQAGYT